ncbi:EF-hand domain-containing protein [Puniceibacterium sediminis]|uniref:EF hand n=1 Tax=Puniceibacterium sediminis TaxID=1608407 RepID=A0A238Y0P6_9RHOB|nr:EF-hand domain-containing protein [Puniceibacterium sediminis]SNR64717.1 EF hand [Puniceibacterium sediminis]
MKTSNWITGALIAAMGLTAVAAQADEKRPGKGDRGEGRGMIFGELDTNGDGELTMEEMTTRGSERFAAADTNSDGQLSVDEMNAMAQARVAERTAQMIERMDKNDDGTLSREEIQGRRDPAKMFERVDRNDDGVVSEEEFAQFNKKMRGDHGKRGDHDRGGKDGKRRHHDHDRG